MDKIIGSVWKFGDDVDTDLIIPARYLNTSDPQELAKHCMEDAQSGFSERVRPGDIIVAGKNFGCGSSREHAPIAIKAAGVSCVVAKSFARIFYRNAFNMGLPILECPETDDLVTGSRLCIDFDAGIIEDLQSAKKYSTRPIPPFMQELLADGGLMQHIAVRVREGRTG